MYDLQLEHVTKVFSPVTAVQDLSLEVKPGEFVALLGPSGCGKTTTLSLIAGFQDLTSGTISIRGRRVEGLPPEKRNTGMVFQNYALFPHMTVAENIAFGLKMKGVPRGEIEGRIRRALAMVRMEGLEARYPGQLSGGQQQRIALARALVIEPAILLLDEPFGALDRQLREQMQVELKTLQRSLGITTVFVTHDQEEALSMSDRVAVLNRGVLEQVVSPTALYERPRTRFVATFIGKSNIFEGKVGELVGDSLAVDAPFGRVVVKPPCRAPQLQQVVEGLVRPEKVRLSPAGGLSGKVNTFPAIVTGVAYHGGTADVYLELPSGYQFLVCDQNPLDARGLLKSRPGDRLFVEWDPADTMIFTEGRLCE